jgi:hypothetical protein
MRMAQTPPGGYGQPQPKGQDRSPVTVAGAVLIAVQASMAALWAVTADAIPTFPLKPGTEGLVTAAIMSLATVVVMVWTGRRTTPTSAPILPESTHVGITNGSGQVGAIVQLPSVTEANASANGGSDNGKL